MALTTNLTHYYKLDSDYTDSVGSLDFTNVSTSLVSAKISNGASANSGTTGQYIYTANEAIGGAGTEMSVSYWVYSRTLSQSTHAGVFFHADSANGDQPTWGAQMENGDDWYCYCNTVNANYSSTTNIQLPLNAWTHMVQVYNVTDGKCYFYQNGSLVYTLTCNNSGLKAQTTKWKGLMQKSSGRSFNGILDEIGIWSRALTAVEVGQLYNSGDGLQYPFSTTATENAIFTSMNF